MCVCISYKRERFKDAYTQTKHQHPNTQSAKTEALRMILLQTARCCFLFCQYSANIFLMRLNFMVWFLYFEVCVKRLFGYTSMVFCKAVSSHCSHSTQTFVIYTSIRYKRIISFNQIRNFACANYKKLKFS